MSAWPSPTTGLSDRTGSSGVGAGEGGAVTGAVGADAGRGDAGIAMGRVEGWVAGADNSHFLP